MITTEQLDELEKLHEDWKRVDVHWDNIPGDRLLFLRDSLLPLIAAAMENVELRKRVEELEWWKKQFE